eukprot:scaffold3118_cov64-Cylindrotheca_fusiformis.AAC.11
MRRRPTPAATANSKMNMSKRKQANATDIESNNNEDDNFQPLIVNDSEAGAVGSSGKAALSSLVVSPRSYNGRRRIFVGLFVVVCSAILWISRASGKREI